MPEYRCLKHDRIFETATDMRRPGSNATDTLPAHPHDGHPDCLKCSEEMAAKTATPQELFAAAQQRSAAAAATLEKARQAAEAAAFDVSQASAGRTVNTASAGRRIA
jgi:hypothetical protein